MVSTGFSIRAAQQEDFADIARMLHELTRQMHSWEPEFRPRALGLTPALIADRLAAADTLNLVAVKAGICAGFAAASFHANEGSDFVFPHTRVWLSLLVVDTHARRGGIGRGLFAAVEAWAEQRGADSMALNVFSKNQTAQSFYQALGYVPYVETRQKRLRSIARLEQPDAD